MYGRIQRLVVGEDSQLSPPSAHHQPLRYWWAQGVEYQWLNAPPVKLCLFDKFFQMYNRFGDRDIQFPIHPHGHLCVSINFQTDHTGVYLFGLNKSTWQAQLTKGEFVYGGAFRIGEVSTLLGIPAIEFTDQIIPFADIWPVESQQLLETIAEATTMFQRAQTLNCFFLEFQGRKSRTPSLITRATDTLYNDPGISIRQLATSLGISRRQLSRHFAQHVGLTPKTVARVFRLKRAKSILQYQADICLSDLSCQLGFYDQPHFNKEFKQFYGAPPVEYIKNGLDLR